MIIIWFKNLDMTIYIDIALRYMINCYIMAKLKENTFLEIGFIIPAFVWYTNPSQLTFNSILNSYYHYYTMIHSHGIDPFGFSCVWVISKESNGVLFLWIPLLLSWVILLLPFAILLLALVIHSLAIMFVYDKIHNGRKYVPKLTTSMLCLLTLLTK